MKNSIVVITKNSQGIILAVTRQDPDGQILEVLAESSVNKVSDYEQDCIDSNYTGIQDVLYNDLFFYIDNCRRWRNKESFDTTQRVLEALKKQVLKC